MKKSIVSVIGIVAALSATLVNAATITWGTAANITDASDVYTAGKLEYAVTLGTAVTLGGVAFSAATYTASTGTTALGSSIDLTRFNRNALVTSSTAAPFTSLNSSYQTLLGKSACGDGGAPSVITLKNLTVGQDYAVQIWANRSEADVDWTILAGALDPNTTDAIGGIGQFIIGTFTADAATQTFAYSQVGGGGGRTSFNAIQVRDVSPPKGTVVSIK